MYPLAEIRRFVTTLFLNSRAIRHDYRFGDVSAAPVPAYRGCRFRCGLLPEKSRAKRCLSKASEDVSIGDKGFEFGSTLDYVVTGLQGRHFSARIVDRQYLNGIGWRGSRQRKVNIEKFCAAPSGHCREGSAERIMDISLPVRAAISLIQLMITAG